MRRQPALPGLAEPYWRETQSGAAEKMPGKSGKLLHHQASQI